MLRRDRKVCSVTPGPRDRNDTDPIAAAYQAGDTVADIAARHRINPATVHRRLARSGVPLRGQTTRRDWSDVLTRDYLADQLAQGHGARTIAADCGAGHAVVTDALHRHGLRPPLSRRERDRLRRWYERDGLTVAEIGERLGLSTSRAVRQRLRDAGVTMRGPGRRPASG